MPKAMHENFTQFFEHPTRDGLRDILKDSFGEADHIDFKESLPDKAKLAKHVLALANSGGGVLIIGIKDDSPPIPVGVTTVTDKADIYKQLSPFLPSSLAYEVLDFAYKDSEYASLKGKTFQVFFVESKNEELPYLCQKAGDGIKDNVVYVRKGTNSTEASHEDLQKLLNKRIETQFSSSGVLTLEEHLEQLKVLYKQLPRHITRSQSTAEMFGLGSLMKQFYREEDNPHFPKECFEDFVNKTISLKKDKIRKFLNL